MRREGLGLIAFRLPTIRIEFWREYSMTVSSEIKQRFSNILKYCCTKAALCVITSIFSSAAYGEDLGAVAYARLKMLSDIQISKTGTVSIKIINKTISNGDALQLYNEIERRDLTRSWSSGSGDVLWDEKCNIMTVLQMEIPLIDDGFAKSLPDGERVFDGVRDAFYFHESVTFTSWIALAEEIKKRQCDITDEELISRKRAIEGSGLGTDQSFAYGFSFYIIED
jgi:hypothetical protein